MKIYLSTYVNITVYPPAQLLYANKIIKKEKWNQIGPVLMVIPKRKTHKLSFLFLIHRLHMGVGGGFMFVFSTIFFNSLISSLLGPVS
jgi:hypothetical protein